MSTDWDLLIENHFDRKSSNKLTLETLLSAVNEVITESTDLRTPIMERVGSPISVVYDGIPEIPLTELGWNKLETDEGTEVTGQQRALLENYLDNIAPGGDLATKIKALDSFYASGFNQIESEKTNEMISKTLSFLVFYKTLTRIITNFNAASAGFTFEAFLATLLGGSQIKANTGTIADFKTADDVPISLKLYAEKTVAVGGSFTDLVRDLVDPKFSHPNGGMRYVVCTKSLAGKPGQQEGGIKFYEFDFTLDNVANIIAGASRAHTAANIILPLVEDEEGNLVLVANIGDLEEPVKFTADQIDQAMRKILSTSEAWQDSGLKDFQIKNIVDSPLIGYQTDGSLGVKTDGAINRTSRANKDMVTPLITDPETERVSNAEISSALTVINNAYLSVVGQQAEINARKGTGIKDLQKRGIFPQKIPKGGGKKNPQIQAVKALAARSRDWYNAQDEETKRKALKYTMGYLKTQQFELNRAESTSNKLVDLRYLGEINIGSSHIQNVLKNCESILNENVTAIFTSLKVLTENLNDYFANGLNEDSKAFGAISAADDIETRTKEVSGTE